MRAPGGQDRPGTHRTGEFPKGDYPLTLAEMGDRIDRLEAENEDLRAVVAELNRRTLPMTPVGELAA